MSWIDDIKQCVDTAVTDVTGEARKVLEAELIAVKQAHADVVAKARELEPQLEQTLTAVEPAVKDTALQLLRDFAAYAETALGVTSSVPPAA